MHQRTSIASTLALLLLPLLAGCGAAVVADDGGPDAPLADRVTPPLREPRVHRAVATECPHERPAGNPLAMDMGFPSQCRTDAECTMGANGRCIAGRGFNTCTYDACFTDAACGAGVCNCRDTNFWRGGANVCVNDGNCRVDADCGSGGYCSPSLDPSCGAYTGVTGYHCHTASDDCVDDADCAGVTPDGGLGFGPPFCGYRPEVGRWTCQTTRCAG